MKTIRFLVFGIAMSLMSLPAAQAAGGKVISVDRVSDAAMEIEIETRYYCNSPIVTLDYLYTGNNSYGPIFYEVNVTPMTRQACFGKGIIRATVKVPVLPYFGRHVLVLKGDEGSSASLEINN